VWCGSKHDGVDRRNTGTGDDAANGVADGFNQATAAPRSEPVDGMIDVYFVNRR
jgi:hypothetical protein